ncbi:MAG TPA: hypothetical protein P5114_08020 [Hyphomicrobiaceae bacterium]|nr:hypothetical protein [Hyphomicrobiaceae bacterium]
MSTPLPTAMELTALAGVAIALSLAGTWLTRRAAQLIGYGEKPEAQPALVRSGPRTGSPRSAPAKSSSPIKLASGLAQAIQASVRKTLLAPKVVLAPLNSALAYADARKRAAPRTNAQRIAMHAVAGHAPSSTLPERLSIDTQWERAANIVNRAVNSTRTARTAHVTASQKLDAAHYALEKLMSELEGIISLKPSLAEVTVLSRASNITCRRDRSALTARAA